MIVFTSTPCARSASDWSSACSTTAPQKDHEYGTTIPTFIAAIIVGGRCASVHHTTGRSSGWLFRPSARSPRSRCTCSSTRRSSAIWAVRSSPRSASQAAVSRRRVHHLQLPRLRDDCRRRPCRGSRPARAGGAPRGPGALASLSRSASACSSCSRRLAGPLLRGLGGAWPVGPLRARLLPDRGGGPACRR